MSYSNSRRGTEDRSLKTCEAIRWQAEAPAPQPRKHLRTEVGQALSPANRGAAISTLLLLALLLMSACGYHVAGHADLMPKTIKTIAIPAFGNATVHQKLSQLISEDLTREFISRTRYRIVADPQQADAVLQGSVTRFDSGATIIDPASNRATGAVVVVILQVSLTDRQTGKVLFSRPSYEFRERYEISIDPQAYFDESGTAIIRLSRDVARSVVTAILVNF